MNTALVFFLGLVVFSHQQLYHQAERGNLFWLFPYYAAQPIVDNYHYQPDNYRHSDNDITIPFLNHLTAASGVPIYPLEDKPCSNTIQNEKSADDDQFPDVQARIKPGLNRFRQWYSKQPKPKYNPRIVINLATMTNFLNKVKKFVFTMTSSVTFTNVQSCIPTTEFAFNAAGTTCRRKRREIIESATNQFAIIPSGIQPVEPTVLASLVSTTEDAQSGNDPSVNDDVDSSKDDHLLDGWQNEIPMPPGYSRHKRLFFHLVTTSTSISYTFLSTTVTKTVNFLLPFSGGQLTCIPEGYAVCPLGTFFR